MCHSSAIRCNATSQKSKMHLKNSQAPPISFHQLQRIILNRWSDISRHEKISKHPKQNQIIEIFQFTTQS